MRYWMLFVVQGLWAICPGCVMEYRGDLNGIPLHEVAADGGWNVQAARIPGMEDGGKLMKFTNEANIVLGVNGRRGGTMLWWDAWSAGMHALGSSTQPFEATVWFVSEDNEKRLYDVVTARQTGTAATFPATPSEPPVSEAAKAVIARMTDSSTALHVSPDGKWVLWIAEKNDAGMADSSPLGVFHREDVLRAFVVHDAATGNLVAVVGTTDNGDDFRWMPDSSGFQTLASRTWSVTRYLLPPRLGWAPTTEPVILHWAVPYRMN